ncbi:MAG: MFS transporter [Halofilum sp. (in: g-proteobacteria)]|nr:MFS transporter [Halofilum sp. (in: g-proteobacteria)]
MAPNVWAWIADRRGQRLPFVRLGTGLAFVLFLGVFAARGFWSLAAVMVAFSFFWNAALPQFEANTFNWLGAERERYSHIRLWGSVGFIATSALLGPLLDLTGPLALPWFLAALYLALWGASLAAPAAPARGDAGGDDGPIGAVLRQPHVWSLLLVCFLMQASHGPYYAFFSLHLQDHGYTGAWIGGLWALGVVAEIGVFLVMRRLLPRFGALWLLLASLALTAVRWLLVAAFVSEPVVLIGAQTLHAASFGLYHAVAIALVDRFFTGSHQGRGQAFYSSMSFGAGQAAGSFAAGLIYGALGGTAAFAAGAGVAALAFVVAATGLRRVRV